MEALLGFLACLTIFSIVVTLIWFIVEIISKGQKKKLAGYLCLGSIAGLITLLIIGISGEKRIFEKLDITNVYADGDHVIIAGNTDLPDGTLVEITFDVAGRENAERGIFVADSTVVSNGKYETKLAIPQRDEFIKGPYLVSVLCSPRDDQTDAVLKIIGKNGERFSGNLVREGIDFKMLEATEKRDLKLTVTPPSYIFQKPNQFKIGTPERALAEYIFAWKQKDWSRMAKYAGRGVFGNIKISAEELSGLDIKDLYGFEIVGVEKKDSVNAVIKYIVQYEVISNRFEKEIIVAELTKLSAARTPSKNGQWVVGIYRQKH